MCAELLQSSELKSLFLLYRIVKIIIFLIKNLWFNLKTAAMLVHSTTGPSNAVLLLSLAHTYIGQMSYDYD